MYLRYLKLINFLGIYIGQNCETLEISMDNKYQITLIRGSNSRGKTVLLSAMTTPFAYDGGIDNRSNLNIIRPGYLGEKISEYQDGEDRYRIHHYYKPTQSGHSVKSYIMKNGIELNPNGNVSSFAELIQSIFGITETDLMLLRLGTNTTSFTSLSSMDRKKYLSTIIEDVNVYMKLYAIASSDFRVNQGVLDHHVKERAKLNISDPIELDKEIAGKKTQLDELYVKLGKLKGDLDQLLLDRTEDINELQSEWDEIHRTLTSIDQMDPTLKNTSIEKMREKRKSIEDSLAQVQHSYNETKAAIDSNERSISFAQMDLEKMTVDDHVNEKRIQLEQDLSQLEEQYKSFHPQLSTNDYTLLYQDVNTIHTLLSVIVGYESSIVDKMLELYEKEMDVDDWMSQQLGMLLDDDSKLSMEQHMTRLLGEGYQIPDCRDANCIYRKLGELIQTKDQNTEMTVDQIKSVKQILATFMKIIGMVGKLSNLPRQLKDALSRDNLIDLCRNGENFSLKLFDQYRSALYGYDSYQQRKLQLEAYKEQESNRQRILIMRGDAEKRIQQLTKSNASLSSKLASSSEKMRSIQQELSEQDILIGKRLEYDQVRKMIPGYRNRLKELESKMDLIRNRRGRIQETMQKKDRYESEAEQLQDEISSMETKYNLYLTNQKEINRLSRIQHEMEKLIRNVNTKENGIPNFYMKMIFDRIRERCNDLLDLTYDGGLEIGEMDPMSPTFDIPYVKNGIQVKDVKAASQGERPVLDISLSFAMSTISSGQRYNILGCDELDSTLDVSKKMRYPEMIQSHLNRMNIEQCFVISHSDAFDTIPCNVIDMEGNLPHLYESNVYEITRS